MQSNARVCHAPLPPYSPPVERSAVVQEAIMEAKAHAKEREEARKAKTQTASSGRVKVTSKHFKQTSKEAQRQGNARELLEDMVHRAERKLAELQRKSHAEVQSAQARAEELATELFHRPGSMLTKKEIARMMIESSCTARKAPKCFTRTSQRFRTIDGTCNNLRNPLLGAADTALVRLIPAQYEDGISSLRGGLQNRKGTFIKSGPFTPPNPSARLVSQTVIRNISEDETLTHILMQWGQFIDHDLSLSPELDDNCTDRVENGKCQFTDICEPIRVADRDPIFGSGTSNNGNCIAFSRSISICEDPNVPLVNGGIRTREQINVLTSFIDGSMIYGSDEEFARRLRLFKGGLLLEGKNFPGNRPELPRISALENRRKDGMEPFVGCSNPGELGCFLAGEFRVNEQIVLTVMHTLWFREHNRIARELATLNPKWNDERLYQEARRIVGALIQKITYMDYLPKIFGQEVYDIVLGKSTGYDPRINPGVNNAFSTAAYRYGHTLIRPFFKRLDSNYRPIGAGPLDLLDAFMDPDQFRMSFGTDPLTRGLVTENSRRVDEFLSSALTNNLFREHLDLASLNIQRGRDHGLPTYLTWQRYCNAVFKKKLPIPEFENTLSLVRFLELYGSLDTVDLWIGGLAEERLRGSLLGPTFACLFGITFRNIRDGDRFFYSSPGVFEPAQLESIEKHTLSSIICDNSDNIDQIQADAFLTNQKRVSCSQIPRVDLRLWKEEPCFFRVTIPPRKFKMPIRSYSRASSKNPFTLFTLLADVSSVDKAVCVPVVCPKVGGTSEVILYTSPRLRKLVNVSLGPNSAVPVNLLSSVSNYRAKWPESIFGGAGTGVFKSKAACTSATASAFTLSLKYIASTAQLSQDILNQLNEQTSDTDHKVDEDIPEIFRSVLFPQVSPPPESPSAQGKTSAESEEETDAQLMSDLEEALKSLKV